MDIPEGESDDPEQVPSLSSQPESDSQEGAAPIPEPLERAVEAMPKGYREVFTGIIGMIRSGASPRNPLADKITPHHLDKLLDQMATDHADDSKHRFSDRKYRLGYAIIGVAAVMTLVLTGHEAFALPILTGLLGFAGGYGLGQARSRD